MEERARIAAQILPQIRCEEARLDGMPEKNKVKKSAVHDEILSQSV